MPQTEVVFFADKDGSSPALEWIKRLPTKARQKLGGAIKRLEEMGHELRRPQCDYLRDKIYELRVGLQHVNYRLLYFYYQQRIVISHGLTKEGVVPSNEIDKAVANRILYEQNPDKHTMRMR